MEEILRNTLLYDFYAELLTPRQRDIYQLYHCNDLSLAEVAEKLDISRQAVKSSLQQSQKSLEELDAALGLVLYHKTAKSHVDAISAALAKQDNTKAQQILLELEKLI